MKQKPLLAALAMTVLVAVPAGFVLLHEPEPETTLPTLPRRRGQGGSGGATTGARPNRPRPVGPIKPTGPVKPSPGDSGSPAGPEAVKVDEGEVKTTKLEAGSPVKIHLEVVDHAGRPLIGALVEPRTETRELPAMVTDEKGLALFRELPDDAKLSALVSHPRSASARLIGPIPVGSRIRLKFPDGETGTLEGSILNQTRAPVAGATLVLARGEGTPWTLSPKAIQLDEAGRFRVELAPGSYRVSARAKSYAEPNMSYVEVTAGGLTELRLTLLPQATVTAEVRESLAAGTAVKVEVIRESGRIKNPFTQLRTHELEVDEVGRFRLDGLDPGRYKVRVSLPGETRRGSPWQRFELEAGGREHLRILFEDWPLSVEGWVLDENDGRIAGAEVRCVTVTTTTDSSGRFELFGLPTGFQDVIVTKEGWSEVTRPVNCHPKLSQTVRVILKRYGVVTGRVIAGGRPAASVRVVLARHEADGNIQLIQGRTGEDGTFRFENVPTGDYTVRAGQGNPFETDGAPHFEVVGGKQLRLPDIGVE